MAYLARRLLSTGNLKRNPELLRKTNLALLGSPQRLYSYDGEGKTTVTVLNKEPGAPLMVDAYSQMGFKLNNGTHVIGPMAIFPKSVLAWHVNNHNDINEQTLSLFFTLAPKLDLLVIGCGSKSQISTETVKAIRKRGINVEILSTDHACTTFNFLNVESRVVAAALIPPDEIRFVDAEIIEHQRRKKTLYTTDDFYGDDKTS